MIPLSVRVGFFLAIRQLRRASLWTTGLIIFIMVLTFLNLVVVSGILVGLIEGSVQAYREYYTKDIIVSTLVEKNYIENSPSVISQIKSLPDVLAISARYLKGGTIEANYKTKILDTDKANIANAQISGIDPVAEDNLTNLSKFVVEGEYLQPSDYDQVMVGALFIKKYLPIDSPGFTALDNVEPGTKIRMRIGSTTREVTVKGIVRAKVDDVQYRVYMVDSQFRNLIGRDDYNVNEIAIKLKEGASPEVVKQEILNLGIGQVAKVQTYEDSQPKFLKDIKATFALLGNMISSIGLAVASITIFIVIFINAITRRKFIGILKGIGIHGLAIEISYIFQSFFYALCGSALGILILYGFLQPFIAAHPIDFPFSDGILVAPYIETFLRLLLLVVITVVAGYIPARMIVRRNTLDAILGR